MSDGSPFELRSIGQVAINVHDLERAIEFYRDVLGLEFLFSAPPQMAFFNCGGVRLLLGVPEEKEFDHPASILYYRVDDIDDAHQKLLARGASFEREPLAVHRQSSRSDERGPGRLSRSGPPEGGARPAVL